MPQRGAAARDGAPKPDDGAPGLRGRGRLDNAVMEPFWSSMQIELLNRQRCKTRVELANGTSEFIEIFYNRQRRHPALGYRGAVGALRPASPPINPWAASRRPISSATEFEVPDELHGQFGRELARSRERERSLSLRPEAPAPLRVGRRRPQRPETTPAVRSRPRAGRTPGHTAWAQGRAHRPHGPGPWPLCLPPPQPWLTGRCPARAADPQPSCPSAAILASHRQESGRPVRGNQCAVEP